MDHQQPLHSGSSSSLQNPPVTFRNRQKGLKNLYRSLQLPSVPFRILQLQSEPSSYLQHPPTTFSTLQLPSANSTTLYLSSGPSSYLQHPRATFCTLQLPSTPSSYLQHPPAPFIYLQDPPATFRNLQLIMKYLFKAKNNNCSKKSSKCNETWLKKTKILH